ncbi:ABC transporter involved in cytochrome c biogenesis, ATPase component CcmA [Bathymodiolus thermophilus thioautotrophic gill symbiont]|uniref:cytochrome c biogenesis heme-transporting ATPase CcmA n=1 Tax=Bathymodiolus thermophilus thioautotrophic gill symbiont TaxID=2360 RepID=UPI0010B23EFB|nr:cytochrome c biogenesis heme-transporting ATPase CcmA [Bathymodiolus thermophilus thioautotrophic gill symbiont]SGZ67297.1 ABC transporter involved in cytochrome c biogenesis, ATPase component CcmA [Bathymodiolus thermophilus thioautotrophic gill symbiont]
MLKINNLSCQKGYNLLFSQLSFTVDLGGILRITGTNGSGKTSLLKILAGLSVQEQGTIFLDNDAVKSEGYQAEIFYLGHLSALSVELTCLENLKFLTALNQSVGQPLLLDALKQMGLEGYENEYCAKLSAGQKRRVALASLILSKAKIWLLDEPFTALDPQGVKMVEQHIEQHCKQGGACLFTTHQDSALKNQKVLAL